MRKVLRFQTILNGLKQPIPSNWDNISRPTLRHHDIAAIESQRVSMSTSSHPVSSIHDIKERCRPIFGRQDLEAIIAWVGVFGSFSRNKQTPLSDVDLLVGFREGATKDDIYYMGDLTEELKDLLQRDVDVLYMRHLQPLDFMRCQALVTGKTVYGSGEWLRQHEPLAKRLLVDAQGRFKEVLRLERQTTERLTPLTEMDLFKQPALLCELVEDVDTLIHMLCTEEEDARGINGYFDVLHEWTLPISRMIKQYRAAGIEALQTEDRNLLWRLLTKTLPDLADSLKKIYLPILQEVFREADDVEHQ
ncbi:hypothetical protein S40293_05710 [Stachybotrys chartarum IBT 40293]|nr:hypothetical protein S40293_05710 [Stachybotrys chartarum IBT 40293]